MGSVHSHGCSNASEEGLLWQLQGHCWERHMDLDLALKYTVKAGLAFYVHASVDCRPADAYSECLVVVWWFVSVLQY